MIREGGRQRARLRAGSPVEIIESPRAGPGTRALAAEERGSGLGHSPEAVERSGWQRRDSRGRSVLKALTWRVVALVITVGTVWLVTGEPGIAAAVGGIDAGVKLVAYYMHERAWDRSAFGRIADRVSG